MSAASPSSRYVATVTAIPQITAAAATITHFILGPTGKSLHVSIDEAPRTNPDAVLTITREKCPRSIVCILPLSLESENSTDHSDEDRIDRLGTLV